VQGGVVLERFVEVGLAIEDGDRDIAALGEDRLQLGGAVDFEDLESGSRQLGNDRFRLGRRERDDNGWTGHD
jgi:hypothetical protein